MYSLWNEACEGGELDSETERGQNSLSISGI